VVERVAEALNSVGRPVNGSRILMLGLAYKANVDDHRESPSFHLMQKLEAKGANVSYNDPYIPIIGMTREFPEYAGRRSVPVIDDNFDALLIATAHDDYKSIDFSKFKCPIIDTRNLVKGPVVFKS
jgi:UDP-N-acetyl-D-glucosamine dehydrogenase